ncbi:response regulator [Paenibacillus sp. PAMC21692]|uniref:response regulator transcription factor n=1 Tax=Paenibacillus sp. PAMC21692 TaxID=2762320 RepID=UPI0021C262AE|nr:response regulator [Paenibacillus sp. PAMC21692]
MWKILIVEDEVHIRTSLRKGINWNESGFEVIGEAGNGARALAFMEKEVPDLVICDILMPVMDGIELLKNAKQSGYSSLFVMLTCMNEFEYARLALQYGAFDYVLKLSMEIETMTRILMKADEELNRRKRVSTQHSYYQSRQMYEHMWEFLHTGKAYVPRMKVTEQLSAMPPHLLVCAVLHGTNRFTMDDFETLRMIEPNHHAFVHEFSGYGQTTFFYWSHKEVKKEQLNPCTLNFPMGLCLGGDNSKLYEAWRSVLGILDRYWYGNREEMIETEYIGEQPGFDPILTWKNERKMIQSLEQGRLEDIDELLIDLWKDMERQSYSNLYVKQTALQLNHLVEKMTNISLNDAEEILHTTSHLQLLNLLRASLNKQAGLLNCEVVITDHNEINKILEYVHMHLDQAITLKSMARYVAMDEHYVSSLFKKKTGKNFIDYLHDIRIEKAKHYLDHTEMTVNEIGQRVGFVYDNYFIKIFKRQTGMTPSQYRNK